MKRPFFYFKVLMAILLFVVFTCVIFVKFHYASKLQFISAHSGTLLVLNAEEMKNYKMFMPWECHGSVCVATWGDHTVEYENKEFQIKMPVSFTPQITTHIRAFGQQTITIHRGSSDTKDLVIKKTYWNKVPLDIRTEPFAWKKDGKEMLHMRGEPFEGLSFTFP